MMMLALVTRCRLSKNVNFQTGLISVQHNCTGLSNTFFENKGKPQNFVVFKAASAAKEYRYLLPNLFNRDGLKQFFYQSPPQQHTPLALCIVKLYKRNIFSIVLNNL